MLANIRIKEPVDSSLAKAAISWGGVGMIAPTLAKRFEAHLSEVIADSGLLLKTTVANKVAMVRPAYRRNEKRLGRFFNHIFRVNASDIELSGLEVIAAAQLIQEQTEEEIVPAATYLIPVKTAEHMLMKLNALQ